MVLTPILPVGGPDRPPSKEMLMQARAGERQRLAAGRAAPAGPAGPAGYANYVSSTNPTGTSANAAAGQETYWSSLSKAVSERTAKLGTVQDSMDQLAESSSALASEAQKFVQTQKRNAVMGGEFFFFFFFLFFLFFAEKRFDGKLREFTDVLTW